MNRLQKKCLIACSLLHGLLLVVLIFGTAFFNSKEKTFESPHIIELIPLDAVVTDGPTKGGGAPAPAMQATIAPEVKPAIPPKPTPPAPKPEPEPEPEPPKPVVETPKPKPVEKETVSEIPVPVVKKEKKTVPIPAAKAPVKPAPIKRKIDISKPTVLNTKEKRVAAEAAANAAAAADKRAHTQRLAALSGSLKKLGSNLSEPTTFGAGGFGGSGQAEINYGDLVLSKYDAAWFAPSDVDDNVAIVKARVVIARNGNVTSATIIKASGNSTMDSSVRNALKLKFIQPFPAGSTDSQRTYIINFNLKSKRGIG